MTKMFERNEIEYKGVIDTLTGHARRYGVLRSTASSRLCRMQQEGYVDWDQVFKSGTRPSAPRRKARTIIWPAINPDTRPYPF